MFYYRFLYFCWRYRPPYWQSEICCDVACFSFLFFFFGVVVAAGNNRAGNAELQVCNASSVVIFTACTPIPKSDKRAGARGDKRDKNNKMGALVLLSNRSRDEKLRRNPAARR